MADGPEGSAEVDPLFSEAGFMFVTGFRPDGRAVDAIIPLPDESDDPFYATDETATALGIDIQAGFVNPFLEFWDGAFRDKRR